MCSLPQKTAVDKSNLLFKFALSQLLQNLFCYTAGHFQIPSTSHLASIICTAVDSQKYLFSDKETDYIYSERPRATFGVDLEMKRGST